MAKAGSTSTLREAGTASPVATREALVAAAIDTLKADGFVGASARSIAARAGCNQALVFYHFGSVANLLLAALDAVGEQRLERYQATVADASSPTELVAAAAAIFREDLEAGHVTVLVEMIAGASSAPGLAAEVSARLEPWTRFAREAIEGALGSSPLGALVPAGEVAHGVVALYLGLDMLTHLSGDPAPALALFDRAAQLATLLQAFGGMPASLSSERQA